MSVWEVWFITVYIALNTENVIVSLVFKLLSVHFNIAM